MEKLKTIKIKPTELNVKFDIKVGVIENFICNCCGWDDYGYSHEPCCSTQK